MQNEQDYIDPWSQSIGIGHWQTHNIDQPQIRFILSDNPVLFRKFML